MTSFPSHDLDEVIEVLRTDIPFVTQASGFSCLRDGLGCFDRLAIFLHMAAGK
jgi:hypothetical protein